MMIWGKVNDVNYPNEAMLLIGTSCVKLSEMGDLTSAVSLNMKKRGEVNIKVDFHAI
jgi:hypothetical protein